MIEKKQLLNENFHKALKNYKEANYQIALTFFNETIKLDTNHADANFYIANVYRELGKREEAKKYYLKTIEIDPNYADAYNHIGLIYRVFNEFDKAINFFQKWSPASLSD